MAVSAVRLRLEGGKHGRDGHATNKSELLGRTPRFAGTGVPTRSLFAHLKPGYSISEFPARFPTVTRGQVDAA